MKLQTIACAVAVATGGLFFTHAINEAIAATDTAPAAISQTIQPTQEQALVSRQLATLVDRQHYLNMRLDANTSNRMLDMYLDSLDPDHSSTCDLHSASCARVDASSSRAASSCSAFSSSSA